MRRIVVAFDSFKGSLTSREAGEAFKEAIREVRPDVEVQTLSIADGGEGLAEAIVDNVGGEMVTAMVSDPLGRKVEARYAIVRDTTAVIAMSAASGLTLLSEAERNPLIASSYGTGELIMDAIKRGCRAIVVGLGGSATNDAGIGMLRALGCRFYDGEGAELCDTIATLEQVEEIDTTAMLPLVEGVTFEAASDVDNPLCGKDGATRTFARQKGADDAVIERMERAMQRYAMVVERVVGSCQSQQAGAGAAGGMGYALLAMLNAHLRSGIELMLESIGFHDMIDGACMVVTGEGSIDRQTLHGKAPYGIMVAAKHRGVPAIVCAGRVRDYDILLAGGFDAVYCITPEWMSTSEAMARATAIANLKATARRVAEEHL